jgi:hypothetical protein
MSSLKLYGFSLPSVDDLRNKTIVWTIKRFNKTVTQTLNRNKPRFEAQILETECKQTTRSATTKFIGSGATYRCV